MSAAVEGGAPMPPWKPRTSTVHKALSLRTGWVALTRLKPSSSGDGTKYGNARAFLFPDQIEQAVSWVEEYAGPDIDLTWTLADLSEGGAHRINQSPKLTVAQKADAAGYSWLAVDLDPGETTLEQYRERVRAFGLTPTLVLSSGRGLHVFWRLDQWASVTAAAPVLDDLVRAFACDAATKDPQRNLRLPGTWNPKDDARRLALVEAHDEGAAYTLEVLSARACELSPRPVAPPTPPRQTGAVLATGDDWPDRYRERFDLGTELTGVTGSTPASGGKWPCPAGHPGDGPPSLTLHPDNPQKAVCHGTGHPHDMGRATPDSTRYTFDVLDLHAMSVGQTVADFMRDERRKDADVRPVAMPAVAEAAPPEDWPEPAPLTTTPAPVPVDGLPPVLANIVCAVVASAQAPVEVPLIFALGALSAASRGCWDVKVTTAWNAGPTALYGVTLAGSGERKSAGEKPLTSALHEAERQVAKAVKVENREREQRRRGAEARRKQAEKDGDEDGAIKELAKAHENRARPVPALVLSDTTTEALGVNMEEQGGAAALFFTEATAFATVAGRYSDGGGNVGLLNQAYDGERYADKRIKRGGVTIPRPILAWAAAVQTEVLTGYANGTTEGSGFLARFLLLLPTSMVGHRQVRTDPVPPTVQAAWDQALTALHARAWEHYKVMTDDADDYGQPLVLHLDPGAADVLLTYAQGVEDAKRTSAELRDLGGWIEKHPARLARIAALFALLDNPYATTVGVDHMRAALTLAQPLVEHATATLRVLRNTGEQGPVRRVLEAVRSIGTATVSTREVHRKVKGQAWVDRADDVRRVLADLADDGYLRHDKAQTGGAPSEVWHVHPALQGSA